MDKLIFKQIIIRKLRLTRQHAGIALAATQKGHLFTWSPLAFLCVFPAWLIKYLWLQKTRVIIVREKETNLIHSKFFYESTAVLEIIRPKEICDAPSKYCAQPYSSQLLICLLSVLCRVLYSATGIQNLSS